MNDMLIKAGKLVLICAVSALLLGIVNSVTEPVIAKRKAADLQNNLQKLIESGTVESPREVPEVAAVQNIYPVSGSSKARAILELSGNGYGGAMKILASYSADGTVLDVVLMDNAETPGLGKKAENPDYMNKFRNTGGKNKSVPLSADQLEVDADTVSGATITFVGIATALSEGSVYVKTGVK